MNIISVFDYKEVITMKNSEKIQVFKRFKAFVVLRTVKNKRYLVASGAGVFSQNDPAQRAFADKLISYKIIDSSANAKIAGIYDAIAERIQAVIDSGKFKPLLIATDSDVAIKYYMSLKAKNEGGNQLLPLILNYGEKQDALVESAKHLLEIMDLYFNLSGNMPIFVDNYNNYWYEPLAVAENAKAQLSDGMELAFNGNDCTTVPGVTFLNKWHTMPCKRTLKIWFKNTYDSEGQIIVDDNGIPVKTPSRFAVHQPRNNDNVLLNERGAFMSELWNHVLKSLPDFTPTPEEQAALIEEEF